MSDFHELIDFIHSIQDKRLLEDFLIALTTPTEREELPKRVDIIKKLIAGESQHKIAQELGVGISTVTRGSKELAQGRFKIFKQHGVSHE